MLHPRVIALGLVGASTLAFGVTAAQASVTVGSPTQASKQSVTTGQVGSQTVGGGVVVGDTTQSGSNSSSTHLGNAQAAGTGSGAVLVGSPSQENSQSGGTSQTLGQSSGKSGVHVGATTQTGSNSSSSTADNLQAAGSAVGIGGDASALVLGNPSQTNSQALGTSQTISQASGGSGVSVPGVTVSGTGGVIVGGVTQSASNSSSSTAVNGQAVGSALAGFGGSDNAVLVGSPLQSSNQPNGTSQVIGQNASGGVIVGGAIGQSQSNSQSTSLTSAAVS